MRRAAAARPRHTAAVGLLAFASGGVDAVTLTVLGGAFTSVVTGNLIFIGRAAGTMSLNPVVHSLIAVVGYVAGVGLGSRIGYTARRAAHDSPWPRQASVVLAAEAALLAGVNAAWLPYHARLPASVADIMLLAAAAALGMQGAAARLVKGSPSTTYMTGALTALIEALVTGRRRGLDAAAPIGLAALVAGAAASAVLIRYAVAFALLPPLGAVTLAVLLSRTRPSVT